MKNFRLAAALGAAACFLLLGYAYYLQYVGGLEPCPLCLVQRAFYYLVGGTLVIAALHGPQAFGRLLYGGLAAFFTIGGIVAAGRQVWLQHLPADKVPACGPDLYFMLKNFPLQQALTKLFAGTGECAVVDWTFVGLSIAEWSLGWFVALFAYSLWLASRGRRSRSAAAASAA